VTVLAIPLLVALVIGLVVFLVGRLFREPHPFPVARGRYLDMLGARYNVRRKRWERDATYRARLADHIRGIR